VLTDSEVEELRQQTRDAHEQCLSDKPSRDMRLAEAHAQQQMTVNEPTVPPVIELANLVADTWDAIEFLRAQMLHNARASDGNDQSDTEREEYAKTSTGAKPKSKPPMNLAALDAADAEMAVLVSWAEYAGIPYSGQVWRVDDVPRGVLYGDTSPARSLAWNISELIRDGWVPPEGMLEAVREVRFANLKAWPELDVYLTKPFDDAPVSEEPALF
jgi:hypothetical protein